MAKKTISLNARPKWPDVQDDYVVWHEEHEIGRIRLNGDPQGTTWEWYITVPIAMPAWAGGTSESRDACTKDFSSAWGRLLKETRLERLERAWELERAATARRPRRDASADRSAALASEPPLAHPAKHADENRQKAPAGSSVSR